MRPRNRNPTGQALQAIREGSSSRRNEQRNGHNARSVQPYNPNRRNDQRNEHNEPGVHPYNPLYEQPNEHNEPDQPYNPYDQRNEHNEPGVHPYSPLYEQPNEHNEPAQPYNPYDQRNEHNEPGVHPFNPDRRNERGDNEEIEEVEDEAPMAAHAISCNWWQLIVIFVCGLYVLGIVAAVVVNSGIVSFHYPPAHWIANEELKDFENFLEGLFSTSHYENTKAVLRIPVVFHQTRYRLDRAVDAILKSDLAGQEWQEEIVSETKQISHLFRDAADEMFAFLIRGRTMLKYMKDLGLPSIGKAFQAEQYAIVFEVLEDMEKHIRDADATIATAKGKMKDCTGRSENVLDSIQKKIPSLDKSIKEASKGWSMEKKVAVYGLAMTLTVVTGTVAAPIIGVGAGFAAAAGGAGAIGGGAAAMKHWIDNADSEELKQRLKHNVQSLEGAYDHMDVVRENLEQVSMDISELVLAVDAAEKSVVDLHGQLDPEKSNIFYFRLKEFARRCSELYNLYDRGIADYNKEDWRKHQALN